MLAFCCLPPPPQEKLIGESNFPWLLSNVVSKADNQQLAHGKRTLIVEHEGWKLGFMGLIEQEWCGNTNVFLS